jgi:hypothetical protein
MLAKEELQRSVMESVHTITCKLRYRSDEDERILTDVVDESYTLDVNMFPVKRVLKKLYDVLSDGVLCRETFGPGEENA